MTEAAYFMQASFHSEDIATSMPQASLLSIGAVAHITGIPEATLRMWERRYQFPRTTRSTGGHRLYEQKDVIQLQWVRGRLDEGMRVHRAVEALHQWTQAKEQDNAIERAVASALAAPLPLVRPPDPSLVSVQHSLLEAVLAYNSERATMILHEATGQHALGLVVLEVVRPTLSAIGELWSVGQIEVATEHFATNLLRHQLLEWMRTTPPPYQTSPVVLACAPEELHEGSLLMLWRLVAPITLACTLSRTVAPFIRPWYSGRACQPITHCLRSDERDNSACFGRLAAVVDSARGGGIADHWIRRTRVHREHCLSRSRSRCAARYHDLRGLSANPPRDARSHRASERKNDMTQQRRAYVHSVVGALLCFRGYSMVCLARDVAVPQ